MDLDVDLDMEPDDVAWEALEDVSEAWAQQWGDRDFLYPIVDFMVMHSNNRGNNFTMLGGSYNITFRLIYGERSKLIRFCRLGEILFPEDKVANEVDVMKYLIDKTSIPVPRVLLSGTAAEGPLKWSPFIMMEYVDHDKNMHKPLNIPGCPDDERGKLDPDIDRTRLETLWRELASVLLKLSIPSLPQIRSLHQVDDSTWEVSRRPLTMNMNELVGRGGLPRRALPDINETFDTASSYLEFLAHLELKHLIHQRNDAISSADDCRRKFVARKLFLKLAKEKKLNDPDHENGPFKLWCDNLRPANALVKEDMIAGVVDWEFTYAAPAEFVYAPPWGLLLERPEGWREGFDDWNETFDYRLKTFLKVMKGCENTAIQEGRLNEEQRLSVRMERSWENGDFWVMYAVSRSFAFDTIYWRKIDARFFGSLERPLEDAWRERLGLLSAEDNAEMEELVARKLEEMEERALVWDPDEYALAFREEIGRRREEEKGKEGGEKEETGEKDDA